MNALMAHLVRSEGKAIHASIGVVIGGVLNIVLDPLFMFVLLEAGNEVAGAAIATALSNVVSFLYYVVIFIASKKKQSILSVKLTDQSFKNKIPACVFDAGLPACIMTLAENISYAILDKLMSYNGLAAQTGIGVAKKVNMLAHSIVRGVTQGHFLFLDTHIHAGSESRPEKLLAPQFSYLHRQPCFARLSASCLQTQSLESSFNQQAKPISMASNFCAFCALVHRFRP